MKHSTSWIAPVIAGLVFALSGAAQAASWSVHDDFNQGRVVSDTSWQPTSIGWGTGVQEIERSVSGGSVTLGLRSKRLKGTQDEGEQTYRRNRLAVKFSESEGLEGMQAKVTVDKASVRGCDVADSEESWVSATMQAIYFNTGAGDQNDDSDYTGDMFATLSVQRNDTNSGLVVRATVGKCLTSDCGEFTTELDKKLMRNAKLGQEITVRHLWKPASGTINFRVIQGGNKRVASYDYTQTSTAAFSSNKLIRANVQSRTVLANCEGGSKLPKGEITARFNEVRLKK